MAQRASRRGASLGLPLMLVSVLLLAGFMYWLYVTAEPTAAPVIEEDTADATTGGPGGTVVDPSTLGQTPAQYEGQTVRLEGVGVAQAVGNRSFFVDLPQGPFLVRMDSTLVARGMMVPTGAVTVVGTVDAISDSLVTGWVESGVISEGDRILVEYGTHYMEASQVETARSGGGGQGDGGDGGDADGGQ